MPSESARLEQIPAERVQECLVQAAAEVLEVMFFIIVDSAGVDSIGHTPTPGEGAEEPGDIVARIQFRGVHRGRFHLILPREPAQDIARNFMGTLFDEAVTTDQVEQVICELANMVCGATLSRLVPQEIFSLDEPRLISRESVGGSARECATQWLRLNVEGAWIELVWCWEGPA